MASIAFVSRESTAIESVDEPYAKTLPNSFHSWVPAMPPQVDAHLADLAVSANLKMTILRLSNHEPSAAQR